MLIYVITATVTISGTVGLAVWFLTAQLAKNRHDMRSHVAQALTSVDEALLDHQRRLNAVEVFNAGLNIMLKSIDEFRADVKQRFETLHRERREDMQGLQSKLDTIIGRGEGDGNR